MEEENVIDVSCFTLDRIPYYRHQSKHINDIGTQIKGIVIKPKNISNNLYPRIELFTYSHVNSKEE